MRVLQNCSLYRHYKGGLYYTVGLALHTETDEMMVVYHALDGDNEMFVRPEGMFMSQVQDSEGTTMNRFELEVEVQDNPIAMIAIDN